MGDHGCRSGTSGLGRNLRLWWSVQSARVTHQAGDLKHRGTTTGDAYPICGPLLCTLRERDLHQYVAVVLEGQFVVGFAVAGLVNGVQVVHQQKGTHAKVRVVGGMPRVMLRQCVRLQQLRHASGGERGEENVQEERCSEQAHIL